MHRCRREARRRRRAFAGGDGVDTVGIYPIGKSSSTEGQSACGGDDEHRTLPEIKRPEHETLHMNMKLKSIFPLQ